MNIPMTNESHPGLLGGMSVSFCDGAYLTDRHYSLSV
jgi:hypothetical protein